MDTQRSSQDFRVLHVYDSDLQPLYDTYSSDPGLFPYAVHTIDETLQLCYNKGERNEV